LSREPLRCGRLRACRPDRRSARGPRGHAGRGGRMSNACMGDTGIRGRVWKFGDNISADDGIIQYSKVPDLATFDIPALKAMCFAELQPDFREQVKSGDVVV